MEVFPKFQKVCVEQYKYFWKLKNLAVQSRNNSTFLPWSKRKKNAWALHAWTSTSCRVYGISQKQTRLFESRLLRSDWIRRQCTQASALSLVIVEVPMLFIKYNKQFLLNIIWFKAMFWFYYTHANQYNVFAFYVFNPNILVCYFCKLMFVADA